MNMISILRRMILLCVCVGTVHGLASDHAQVISMEPFHGPNVSKVTHYGNSQWLYPLDEPNETMLSEPSYGSEKRVYYAARYGDAEDNIYTFVLDEKNGTGTGFDTLYVDLNNDDRIDVPQESFSVSQSGLSSREKKPVRVTLQVRSGEKLIPYAFEFTFFAYKAKNDSKEKYHANCRNSTISVGKATFQDKVCKIAIADLDSNGLYNDYEMGTFNGDRFFVDLDGDGDFQSSHKNEDQVENFPYARYSKIGGDWYTIHVTPDGGRFSIAPARLTRNSRLLASESSTAHFKRYSHHDPVQRFLSQGSDPRRVSV